MVQIPTETELKSRYPEFDPVDGTIVNEFISEASRTVDDTWEEADQKPAIMALAAHLMALEGWPKRATNPNAFNPFTTGREMAGRKVGDVSVQFATSKQSSSGSGLFSTFNNTVYGQRFATLLKLNAPAIGVTNGGQGQSVA